MAATATNTGTRSLVFEPEHQYYAEAFTTFIEREIRPHYAEWRKAGIVPAELFTKAAEGGFLAMGVPEEFGGPGAPDWRFNVVLNEISAKAGVADAFSGPLLHTDVCLPYILESANDEQKARWLPGIADGTLPLAIAMTEPGTGSDLAAIQTTARRDGDHFVINGAKTFITNGINAKLVIVAARTSEDKHRGLSLIVVEDGMAGFERGKKIEKVDQHASDTAELFFDDVRVPVENLLGEEGTGFFQLVSRLVPERLTLAVGSQAGAERTLQLTLDYVKERKAFGKPIGSFQHSRFTLAELHTQLTINRAFVDQCVTKHVAGQCTVEEAAMAKYASTELACKVADVGVQLHGGYGYTTEYEISQAWTDARVGKIYAGTNEIMLELIGRTMGL